MKIDDLMEILKEIDEIKVKVTELKPEEELEVRENACGEEGICNGDCKECKEKCAELGDEPEEFPGFDLAKDMAKATVDLTAYFNSQMMKHPEILAIYNATLKLLSEIPGVNYYIQVIKK